MADAESKKSLVDELREEAQKPLTMKDRLVGVVMALALAGLGAAMINWPDVLSLGPETLHGRNGRLIARLLEYGWSRGVGGLLILLAVLVFWGTLTKKGVQHERIEPP